MMPRGQGRAMGHRRRGRKTHIGRHNRTSSRVPAHPNHAVTQPPQRTHNAALNQT